MTASALPAPPGLLGSQRTDRWSWAGLVLSMCVFLGGFVIFEPAPYELALMPVLIIWFIAGLKLRVEFGPLIVLLILFQAGGLISATQTDRWEDIPIYYSVSIFLAATSIFFAAVVADDPNRLKTIINAWLAAGIAVAVIGILGYFHAFPGAELFTLYDRARGPFADPNVYGPFLVLPAAWYTRQILTRPLHRLLGPITWMTIIAFGIFLSFSRAAWALSAFVCVATALMVFVNERNAVRRARLVGLAGLALILLVAMLAIALTNEQVSELFTERAKLVQDYDGARLGRFERHWIGFALAAEKPLGIGALEFGKNLGEDPHNTLLKSLLAYGWLGFVSYVTLIAWTLAKGFTIMFKRRPWAATMQCIFVVFVGHILIGLIIDTDHWRHLYLLVGLIWGIAAVDRAYVPRRYRPVQPMAPTAAAAA